jgi:hypothetical protein
MPEFLNKIITAETDLICTLFYDALQWLTTVTSNNKVISEWWIGKDLEGSGRDLICRNCPGIRLEGLRKTAKNLSQDSQSSSWYLNPGPPEYKAGVLTIRSRRSVRGGGGNYNYMRHKNLPSNNGYVYFGYEESKTKGFLLDQSFIISGRLWVYW